jgi:hypothetical protein
MIYLIVGLSVLIVILTVLMYLLNSKKLTKIQKHAPIVGKGVLTLVVISTMVMSFISIKYYTERPVKPEEVIEQVRDVLSKEYPDKIYNPADLSLEEEFTKKSAIDTLTTLLNKVVDKDNSTAMKDRYDAIAKDSSTYTNNISPDVISRLYQRDSFNTDEMKANMSLALLSITNFLRDGDTELTVKATNIENVYLSPETNTVRIPLDIYSNRYSGYTVDMVFIDGHWYIDSYSLMSQVDIISYLQKIYSK